MLAKFSSIPHLLHPQALFSSPEIAYAIDWTMVACPHLSILTLVEQNLISELPALDTHQRLRGRHILEVAALFPSSWSGKAL